MKERIQKILSNYGLGSRRAIEKKIFQKLIQINGKTVSLGQSFLKNEIQYVLFNNKKFFLKKDITRVIVYNKPIGEICTKKDEKKRNTVFDRLPQLFHSKWINIGRLDINTSGLLLFTNYGELAHRLMHPRYMIKREYLVKVFGKISKNKILTLKNGIKIGSSVSKFYEIYSINNQKKNQWFKVSLLQGKNREVRLLWKSVDVQVNKLIRISYGSTVLPRNLPKGKFIELNSIDIKNIFNSVNL